MPPSANGKEIDLVMQPFPSDQEVEKAQRAAKSTWTRSRQATGLRKMQLVHQAFPYAINGGPAAGGLTVRFHLLKRVITVCDASGFVTAIDEDDLGQLLSAVKLECSRRGSLRELVTGVKPPERSGSEVPSARVAPSSKISLSDIGLE